MPQSRTQMKSDRNGISGFICGVCGPLFYFPATVVEAATAAIIFGNDSLI